MFGKKQSAEPAKVTSTSLAEESAKIIDVFEKAVTNLKEVASRAQAEKEVREQEIIELQTEAANLEAVSNKATWPRRLVGCYHNIMDKIRDVSEIDFKVEEVMKAKSFNDFVNGDVEKAFYLGFFRNELQQPLSVAMQIRGDEGIALVKSFDEAMQKARPYVEEMSAIADDAMAKEEFTMLDVVNEVSDKVNYKQEEDKFYVIFILGMWVKHLIDEDVISETEEDEDDEDFVENPNADA
jgi:hypothetical protein